MKKSIILVLVAAVMMFVACSEKEKDNVAVDNPSQREVTYTADTREHTAVLQTDDEWTGLVHNLVDSAFFGRSMTVAIDNIEHKPIPTKEVITYTTMSRDSAEAWIARMSENGYRVAFSFDGLNYRCVAMDYMEYPDTTYLTMPLAEYIVGSWRYGRSREGDWNYDRERFTFYDNDSVYVKCAGMTFAYEVLNDSVVRVYSEPYEEQGGLGRMPKRIFIRRVSMDEFIFVDHYETCSLTWGFGDDPFVRVGNNK